MPTSREQQIRQVNEILEKWRGAHAQLWSYTASLATLEIRLFFDDRFGNLHLVCSPCVSISSPAFWERCELAVAADSADDDLFVVRDAAASVRVLCRQLSTSENVQPLLAFGAHAAPTSAVPERGALLTKP
jgi:hypothetical protein